MMSRKILLLTVGMICLTVFSGLAMAQTDVDQSSDFNQTHVDEEVNLTSNVTLGSTSDTVVLTNVTLEGNGNVLDSNDNYTNESYLQLDRNTTVEELTVGGNDQLLNVSGVDQLSDVEFQDDTVLFDGIVYETSDVTTSSEVTLLRGEVSFNFSSENTVVVDDSDLSFDGSLNVTQRDTDDLVSMTLDGSTNVSLNVTTTSDRVELLVNNETESTKSVTNDQVSFDLTVDGQTTVDVVESETETTGPGPLPDGDIFGVPVWILFVVLLLTLIGGIVFYLTQVDEEDRPI